MQCPFCQHKDTKVIDSRWVSESNQVRRRRECIQCSERFTTYEGVELAMPRVVKRNGDRESFNEDKLRKGVTHALEKRPVSAKDIDALIQKISSQMRAIGEREVDSGLLGEWVMGELKGLDQVAYVRFASIYRSFQDVDEFRREIERLLQGESA
ncbi:transcriptional regulator NrdR [Piscirickettsia litoralis]|uniref:Transcriptional repressor NrdR n=1 Tax=Piscirickettsia litoralis TaxID=1891921 RepID=A0ABX3A477_9GAMM|nr:transcriptional regulator NrdR [Piscirickettsia litoralis]ODN43677.1 transcriptional regulator NrdR [Piscirickettsia litoralis]